MPDERVVALPVQLIEVPDGVIVKRGVDELLVSIQSAAAIAGALARAGAPGGVLVAELPEIIHRAAAEADADALIAELRRKRMLVDPADASPDAESPEEILAWNTGRSPKAARAAFERTPSTCLASTRSLDNSPRFRTHWSAAARGRRSELSQRALL